MFEAKQARLHAALQRSKARASDQARLEILVEAKSTQTQQVAELTEALKAEERDVRKLEKKGWGPMKAKVSGDIDETIAREQLEAQNAAEALAAAQSSLAQVEVVAEALAAFDSELCDDELVGAFTQLNLGLDQGFLKDAVFDSILPMSPRIRRNATDIAVHENIEEAQQQAINAHHKLRATVEELRSGRKAIEELIERRGQERLALLAGVAPAS